MVKESNTRVMITISQTMADRLSYYSEVLGVPKSSLAQTGLAMYLLALDKSVEAVNKLPEVASGQITLEEVLKKMVEEE